MLIRAGVLSNTHLARPDDLFVKRIRACFHACDVIIHAGDITSPEVMEVFNDRLLYAVHGNMCNHLAARRYPDRMLFKILHHSIGLIHGDRLGQDREHTLWNLFPEADCIISGHTHSSSCQFHGDVLFLNPGSFQPTSRHGSPGTYAILEIGERLQAGIYEVPLG